MPRTISFFSVIFFIIWILPFGYYINPNQEKSACNGQRAICQCSHLIAKYMAKQMAEGILSAAPANSASSVFSTTLFLITPFSHQIPELSNSFKKQASTFHTLESHRLIEHVPRHILI